MTNSTRTRTSSAFTLIELLVVISIISLLISILLPALGAAREAARGSQCLSNFRQAGIGTGIYHVENKGYFPHVAWRPNGTAFSNFSITISAALKGEAADNQFGGPDGNAGLKQINEAFVCPTATGGGDLHYSANPLVYVNETRNLDNRAFKFVPMPRVDDLIRGSELMSMFDAPQRFEVASSNVNYGNAYPEANWAFTDQRFYETGIGAPLFHNYYVNGAADNDDSIPAPPNVDRVAGVSQRDAQTLRYRHGGDQSVNGLYVDGHASAHRIGDTIKYRNLRPERP